MEDIDAFRQRARTWISANLPPLPDAGTRAKDAPPADEEAVWQRARELQRMLYDGRFAGICYPEEYGGLGLTPAHQVAFTEATVGYEMPLELNMPTLSICAPTILDMGSEEQKREHLPAIIRGDEILAQFLSEPRGGSDLAGVTTRATKVGDHFVVNGAKIWSSGAYAADYALCLVRTDWDVPKHQGLTMMLMKVHQPGVTIRRIEQIDGNTEFCEEFFDDVELPATSVVGEVNGGWAVASRQLFHERTAVGGGSPYVSGGSRDFTRREPAAKLIELLSGTSRAKDARVRDLIAESHALTRVREHLINRVVEGMQSGELPPTAGAIIRLFGGETGVRQAEIGLEVAGSLGLLAGLGESGAAYDRGLGEEFLMRQVYCLGGGSTEMARNVIGERLLGMPREYAADREVPFNQVRQGA